MLCCTCNFLLLFLIWTVNDLGGGAHGGTDGSARPADAVVAEIRKAGGKAVANYGKVSTMTCRTLMTM